MNLQELTDIRENGNQQDKFHEESVLIYQIKLKTEDYH